MNMQDIWGELSIVQFLEKSRKPFPIGKRVWAAFLLCGAMAMPLQAGDLVPAHVPDDAGSAMVSGRDILNRLERGTNAPLRSGAFSEPSAGPTAGTMPTLNEIMAAAPATNAAAASPGDVLADKVYWGLVESDWGTRTGTIATRTLSATNNTVLAGYYAATTLTAVDVDLLAENIKTNVTIFGIAGTLRTNAAGSSYPAAIPKTGQTNSYRSGDDGALQSGIAPPSPRFTDHGDGTVTDNRTSLMWVKAPHTPVGNPVRYTWTNAIDYCNSLDFAGYTDWRMPNVREQQSLVDYGCVEPALPQGHPFTAVQSQEFWSSTTYTYPAFVPGAALRVNLLYGLVSMYWKETSQWVWPVRGGP